MPRGVEKANEPKTRKTCGRLSVLRTILSASAKAAEPLCATIAVKIRISPVALLIPSAVPRKKDGTAKFEKLLLELYERKKLANRDKKPEAAVMPVEEMGIFSGIARQTMYEYLKRWVSLGILKKTSFVANGKVIIGYELNGNNLEGAFGKASQAIHNHTETSLDIIRNLQLEIKKEKLRSGSEVE